MKALAAASSDITLLVSLCCQQHVFLNFQAPRMLVSNS